MDMDEIAPHVDDIARVLGDKLDREEIEKEIRNYVEVYRVPLGTAKRSIVKKYGGNPMELSVAEAVTIEGLRPNVQSVDLLARIVSVNPKEIGEGEQRKQIFYGILGDQTGTVPFTSWEPEFPFDRGDVISIKNAYTKEWQGQVQVNFGGRTSFSKEDPDALPKFEGGSAPRGPARQYKISELKEGIGNATIQGRVLSVEARDVVARGEEKTVYSGLLADESGKIQFSAWHDHGLEAGKAIKIENGYVKSWRGIPQFNFGESSVVTELEKGALPDAEKLKEGDSCTIREVDARGGAVDASIRGFVVDLRPGSGLIHRCPECNRVMQKGSCRVHGQVKGLPDLRAKAVLDDGEGTLTLILNRELTEGITGKTMEEYSKMAQEAMDTEPVRLDIAETITMRPVKAKGNVTKDEFGLMMIASDVQFPEFDAKEAARRLMDQMGGEL